MNNDQPSLTTVVKNDSAHGPAIKSQSSIATAEEQRETVGTKTLSPAELQVKSLADQAKRINQQAKVKKAQTKLSQAQEKLRVASAAPKISG